MSSMREYREWSTWVRISKRAYPYAEELLSNEVYVLVSAIAMNALLAFFPFVLLLISISTTLFPSWQVHTMIYEILRHYLPFDSANQEFIISILDVPASRLGKIHVFSLLLLIWSIANVFIPLEMALNRAWNVHESRGFWKSQWLAMIMVVISSVLSIVFIAGAAFFKYRLLEAVIGPDWPRTHAFLQFVIVKAWMVPLTLAMFYVIFYLVPNTTVAWKDVLPAAVFTGLMWEASNYVFLWVLPLLGLRDIYGGFVLTVTLMTWGYTSSIILLFGAQLTAKRVLASRIDQVAAALGQAVVSGPLREKMREE